LGTLKKASFRCKKSKRRYRRCGGWGERPGSEVRRSLGERRATVSLIASSKRAKITLFWLIH
jgi:hypothetical protein